jgi:hypothetical protein
MHLLSKIAARGIVAAGLTMLVATTAFASDSVRTDGASLDYYSSKNQFVLKDTKCDNQAAYAKYRINNGPAKRYNANQGCNTSTIWTVPGHGAISYQACVDIRHWPDQCSGWLNNDTQ